MASVLPGSFDQSTRLGAPSQPFLFNCAVVERLADFASSALGLWLDSEDGDPVLAVKPTSPQS